MRRPSGERQIRSVTNAISRPFQANSHGHDPLRRWLGRDRRVRPAARTPTAARRSARSMRITSAVDAVAEAEVDDRRVDRPALQVQPGAHLDLAADAERVDALIAGRGRRLRPHGLPVVAGRAGGLRASTAWPSRDRRPDRGGRRRRRSAAARTSAAGGVPASGANCPGPPLSEHGRRAGPAGDQVDRAVVVEVGGDERACCRRRRWAWTASGVRVHAPIAARRARRSMPSTPSVDQIEGGCRRWLRRAAMAPTGAGVGAPASRVEGAAAQVQLHVDAAGVVEERGVGHALAVEVGPGEAAHARARRRTAAAPRTCRRRCCAAATARPHRRGASTTSRSPSVSTSAAHARAGRCAGDRRRQRRRRRDVGEAAVRALAQEREAGARGDDEVGAEVVVEIRRQHRVGTERRHDLGGQRGDRLRADPHAAGAGVGDGRRRLGVRDDHAGPRRVGVGAPPSACAENCERGVGAARRLAAGSAGRGTARSARRPRRAASRPARARGGKPARARGRSSGTATRVAAARGFVAAAWRSASSCACAGAGHDGASARQHVEARVHRGGVAALGGEADRVEARRQVVAAWRAASRARAAPRRRSRACPAARSPAPARRPP